MFGEGGFRKLKTKPCDLCGKPCQFPKYLHCGGYVNVAHPKCTEIGNKAIEQYLEFSLVHPLGFISLVHELQKAWDRIHPNKKEAST
jgi:hypothetical protein